MASENGTGVTIPQDQSTETADVKGKGKALATENPQHDTAMDEDDDDDDEDDDDEGEEDDDAGGAEEEDGMEEIDLENVVGRRTRGKVIDFAKAAEENPPEGDDDEEDDDDFDGGDGQDGDQMDED